MHIQRCERKGFPLDKQCEGVHNRINSNIFRAGCDSGAASEEAQVPQLPYHAQSQQDLINAAVTSAVAAAMAAMGGQATGNGGTIFKEVVVHDGVDDIDGFYDTYDSEGTTEVVETFEDIYGDDENE